MQISRVFPLAGGLLLGALAACQNAGSNLGFNASQAGAVFVGVYLDRDGSRTQSAPLDTVFAGARVALLARGTTDTIRIVATDSKGLAQFAGVPVGEYRIAVDPASIGDSIQVAAIDPADVTLVAGGTDPIVIVRLGYPEVSIRQARGLPFGKRAFIRAIILVGVQAFRDQSSHVSDSSGQIRLTQVEVRGGLVGNNPGDSVTVLGTASSQFGQPTLDRAIISRFATRPPPIPLPVSTATAATANGGLLDAGLVQVIAATISDTATVAPDFQVTANDASGPLRIILDANLPFPRGIFRPGRSLNVKGVLVPNGTGAWNLKPRELSDVVFND